MSFSTRLSDFSVKDVTHVSRGISVALRELKYTQFTDMNHYPSKTL